MASATLFGGSVRFVPFFEVGAGAECAARSCDYAAAEAGFVVVPLEEGVEGPVLGGGYAV